MQIARNIHLVLAWLLVAGLVVQIFLAGLGVFAGAQNFAIHRDWGFLLQIVPFAMMIAGWVGRIGRRRIGLTALVFVLFFVQSFLLLARDAMPAIAALHPVNGFVMAWLAVQLARAASADRAARPTAASTSPEDRPAPLPTG